MLGELLCYFNGIFRQPLRWNSNQLVKLKVFPNKGQLKLNNDAESIKIYTEDSIIYLIGVSVEAAGGPCAQPYNRAYTLHLLV